MVAFLYEFVPLDAAAEEARTLEGTLGNANITTDDLVGPLEGESLDALVDLIESGEVYVNLHTVATQRAGSVDSSALSTGEDLPPVGGDVPGRLGDSRTPLWDVHGVYGSRRGRPSATT